MLMAQPQELQALITGGIGNDVLHDPGWPAGAAAVFNSPTRVAWWEGPPFGGGQWHAECRGDADALNRVLADFARIEAKHKRIVLHDGVGRSFWLDPNRQQANAADVSVDWVFVIWQPETFQRLRQLPANLRPPDIDRSRDEPIPQIDFYTGGRVRWSDVQVPAGIEVVDERLEAHGFHPDDGTVFEGQAVDLVTQAALPAQVHLQRIEALPQGGYQYSIAATAPADASGRWVLKSVPAGRYRLIAECEGYVPRVVAYIQTDEQPRWASYSTSLSRPATVSGRVVDADAQSLADVEVRLDDVEVDPSGRYESPTDYTCRTAEDGSFRIDQVPIGKSSVWVNKPGYCRHGLGLAITTPVHELALTMLKAATLTVTVDFTSTVRPEGYIVQVAPEEGEAVGRWSGSGNIDASGSLQYENVPPGRYVITGRPNPGSDEQQTEPMTVVLEGGRTTLVTLQAK
jgi:hypothetical protein